MAYRRRKIFRGRKRSASKKRFSGKRKRFSRKRGGFAKRVKAVVMQQLTADSSYIYSYADQVATTGTIDAIATQRMWATNQVASGSFTANSLTCLQLDDPQDLLQIQQGINTTDTVKFTVKRRSKEMALTNTANCAIELWEYRCQSRTDSLIGPDPTLQDGYADATVGVIALPTATSIGATPFQNPRFVANYKVVKVRKWLLQPSQRKVVKYSLKKPRQYNSEMYAPNAVVKSIMRGQRFSVFVIMGTFASNLSGTAGHDYGIGIASVGMVVKCNYHYSWINDVQGERSVQANLYGFTAGVGGATAGFVPHPIITNHPDSAIAPFTVTGGLGVISNVTAGDRTVDGNVETRYAVGAETQTF